MKKILFAAGLLAVFLALVLVWKIRSSPGEEGNPADMAAGALASREEAALPSQEESLSRRDVSSEATQGAPSKVRIRTVDKGTGVPVSGAEVFLALAERSVALGASREDGLLEAEIPRTRTVLDLVARAPGFAALRRSFARPSGTKESLVLRLAPGRTLEGKVVWRADGLPAGAGFRVLASEDGVWPTLREARRAFLGESGLPVAETREDGSFRLEGLPPGPVRIWAGGPGGAVPYGGIQVPGEAREAEIPVLGMVGARVRLQERGGGALRTSQISNIGGILFHYLDPSNRKPDGVDPFGAALAGIELRWLEPGRIPPWEFLLLKAEWEDGRPVQVEVKTDIPGYKPHAETIELPPLTESSARYDLFLDPEGFGWGTLEVVFSGLEEGPFPSMPLPIGVGKLKLERVGEKKTYWKGKGSFWSTFETLKGRTLRIPRGDYRWAFQTTGGAFRVPASGTPEERPVVTIGADPQRIEIDCSLTGGLEILPRWEGEPFRGQLLVRLFPEKDPGHPLDFSFGRPPYRIPLLPSGFYQVEGWNPPGGRTKVFVAPGRFEIPVAMQLKQGDLVR